MAEALVSAIIQQLVNAVTENAKQEWKLVTGVGKEVKQLQSNFEAIQCVLEDAEQKQIEQSSVKHWLARLKDVAYDMDDVLDEWRTAILKLEIDGVESVYVWKKVCSFLSCFASGRRVARRRDIAIKIKEINKQVDKIAEEKNKYELARSEIKQPRRLESTSFVDVSKLHGRDYVKNKIVSTLLGGKGIQTISIVGMGGLGKTALAQLIFNDDKVRAHFKNVIWVCVSDFFDQNEIARAILRGLDKDSIADFQNPIPLENVWVKIREKIKSTKFLLVLDDVWTDRDEDWESLKAAFQHGKSGSRILVTTRKESVATGMGSSQTQVFRLKELSDEVCWQIISQVAFVGRDNELHENLEDIGRKIAKKCKGLPLAAKSLGGLLRGKKTRNEWQNILNSEIWKLNVAKENIFTPLLLSYHDLPPQIRPCLLYCAVFPKDSVIRPHELIKHWMAHGYLNSDENLGEEEEKGKDYFNYLASRSFFQDFQENWDGSIDGCKMHDMVHDFVQHLTKEEIVTVEVGSLENGMLNLSSEMARHLRVTAAEKGQFPMFVNSIEKLRSLVTDSKCDVTGEALQVSLKGAKCLRLLNFGRGFSWSDPAYVKEISKEVGKLIHLRYLKFSRIGGLKELPKAVCELYNLQCLNLNYCRDLEKLPDDIEKLINLRSLSTEGCSNLHYPKVIGRLTSLRELRLDGVRGDGNNADEFSVGDFEKLNLLRGSLDLYLRGSPVDENEIKRAKFHNKRHLEALILRWPSRMDISPIRRAIDLYHFDFTVKIIGPNTYLVPRRHIIRGS